MKMNRVLICLLFCVALPAWGCAPTDSAVMTQADRTNGGLQPAIMQDASVNAYLQQIGRRIVAAAKQLDSQHIGPPDHFKADNAWMFSGDVQFHLVNSKTLNAFTTGGNHVYIYNELFQQTQSEDALAAVMAHEFAHIYCRHVHQDMRRQTIAAGAATGIELLTDDSQSSGGAGASGDGGGGYSQALATAVPVVSQFVVNGYTRTDEDQADEYGFQFYCAAGWDPDHFADFFKHMIAAGYDGTPTLLSDHPKLADRVDHTNARAQQFKVRNPTDSFRQPNIASQAQFDAYKQTAQQVAARTPDDQSLTKARTLLDAFPSCVARTETAAQVAAKQKLVGATTQGSGPG